MRGYPWISISISMDDGYAWISMDISISIATSSRQTVWKVGNVKGLKIGKDGNLEG